MTTVICSNNIKVYRNILSNTYKKRKIHYQDLKKCIKDTWTNVKFIDIVIQDNQFNLQICCDEHINCDVRRYFDVVAVHRFNQKNDDEQYTEADISFVKVAKELNEWHIGNYTLERLNSLAHGYDYDTDTDIDPNKSVTIPLGLPISRIIEFYGVRGV